MNGFSFGRYVYVLLLLVFVLFYATPSRGEDENFGGDELLDADFWSFEPFDDTVEKIDPEYHGHSLLLLDKAIQANPKFYFPDPAKFSKVASYRSAIEARQKNVLNAEIFQGLRFKSRFAFVLPNDGDSWFSSFCDEIKCSYREEEKVMVVALDIAKERLFNPEKHDRTNGFNPLGFEFPNTPYLPLVTEGMGNKVKYEIGLVVDYLFDKKTEPQSNGVWLISDVSREKFDYYRDYVRVLCVFSLDVIGNAQIGRYEYRRPYAQVVHELVGKDVEFWVYDGYSGKILAKFSPEEMYKGVKKPLGTLTTTKDKKEEKVEEAPKQIGAKEAWDSIVSTAELPKNPRGSRVPDVTIPDDAASLAEALEKCPDGGTILVRQGKNLTLGSSAAQVCPGAGVEKRVLVVGETGNPDDVLFALGENESLWVTGADSNAVFYGVGFEYDAEKRSKGMVKLYRPLASVTDGGKARFINCAFHGSKTPTTPETLALCKGGTARFERCFFTGAVENAALVDRDGVGRFDLCEFYGGNLVGLTSISEGKAEATRSIFSGNKTGLRVLAGGRLKIESCVFEKNGLAWNIAAGNSGGFEQGEQVVVED